MSGEERYDAFLSYARVDDETAVLGAKGDVSQFHAVLELELRKHGKRDLKIFIDREIRSGLRWRDVLEKQLNEANFMVCMLSPSFFKSTECRAEVKYFGERARAAGHKPKLHPVVIQDLSGVPQDEFFAEMLDHQLVDFTEIKLEAPNSKTYRQFVMAFAKQIHASADKVVPMVPTMDSMRRELAAAEQDRADLTERVAELTARLSQSTDEVPELREARDQLAQDLENARSISLAQAREIEKLKRLLSAPSPPSPDVTRLQNELASLHSDRERLTADLARSADSLKKAVQEARAQSAALEKANRDYLASQAKNGELVAQVGALAQSEERLKSDLQDATNKALSLARDKKAHAEALKAAKAELEQERQAGLVREGELSKALAEVEKLTAQVKALRIKANSTTPSLAHRWGQLICLLAIGGNVLLLQSNELRLLLAQWSAVGYASYPIYCAIALILPSLFLFDSDSSDQLIFQAIAWGVSLVVILVSVFLPVSGVLNVFFLEGFGPGLYSLFRTLYLDLCILSVPAVLALASVEFRDSKAILSYTGGLVAAVLAYYSGAGYTIDPYLPLYIAHPMPPIILGCASILLFATYVYLGPCWTASADDVVSGLGLILTVFIGIAITFTFFANPTAYSGREWYWNVLQLGAVYGVFALAWKGALSAAR